MFHTNYIYENPVVPENKMLVTYNLNESYVLNENIEIMKIKNS